MKKMIVPIAVLLLIAVYWRATSHRETGSSTISSWKPVSPPSAATAAAPPVERKTASATTGRPVTGRDSRQLAIDAFESKRRAAGNENAPPLPPPMDAYKDIPKTDARTINDRPFHVLGATAVPRDRYTGSMGKLLLEENGFAIVELKSADGKWEDAVFHADARPVLVSPNGRVAIMTGTLLVKVTDLSAVDEIAAREQLTIITKDVDTRTAYLQPPEGYALLAGQARLQKDPRVERVEIELWQSRKEHK